MGILNKLMFWRKEPEEITERELPEGFEQSLDQGDVRTEVPPWSRNMEEQRLEAHQERMQQQYPQQQPNQGNAHEVILAKLDVINAKLDSINQRLANLEQGNERPTVKW